MNGYEALLAHIPPALMVLARLSGLMIYAPVFGSPVIPVRIKAFLVILITLAVYPMLSSDVIATMPPMDLWALGPILAFEMLIGLGVGWLASIPLMAVQTGGLVMGQQMGLGFASFFNPAIDDEAELIGQLLFFMALAGFLAIGGHEAMLLAVLHSFERVPVGGMIVDADFLALLGGLLGAAFELALRVAAPLLALIFIESVAMGFIAKTVPQLNILSLGFPLRILAGFAVLMLGLHLIDTVVMESIDAILHLIFDWIDGAGEGATIHG